MYQCLLGWKIHVWCISQRKIPDIFEGFFVDAYQVDEHNTKTLINSPVLLNASYLCQYGIRESSYGKQIFGAKTVIVQKFENIKDVHLV